jgi:hypothetical protein
MENYSDGSGRAFRRKDAEGPKIPQIGGQRRNGELQLQNEMRTPPPSYLSKYHLLV